MSATLPKIWHQQTSFLMSTDACSQRAKMRTWSSVSSHQLKRSNRRADSYWRTERTRIRVKNDILCHSTAFSGKQRGFLWEQDGCAIQTNLRNGRLAVTRSKHEILHRHSRWVAGALRRAFSQPRAFPCPSKAGRRRKDTVRVKSSVCRCVWRKMDKLRGRC